MLVFVCRVINIYSGWANNIKYYEIIYTWKKLRHRFYMHFTS